MLKEAALLWTAEGDNCGKILFSNKKTSHHSTSLQSAKWENIIPQISKEDRYVERHQNPSAVMNWIRIRRFRGWSFSLGSTTLCTLGVAIRSSKKNLAPTHRCQGNFPDFITSQKWSPYSPDLNYLERTNCSILEPKCCVKPSKNL